MPDEFLTDWANLPAGVQPVSLSDSLRDAQLRALRSDLRARTVTIEFAPVDLIWSDGLAFTFMLEGVQSVRASRYSVSPGGLRIRRPSRQEQHRPVPEDQAKGREESESWEAFELAVSSDEEAELTDGDLVRGTSGTTALRLEVQMSKGEPYEIFIRGEGLKIRRSDGQAFSLEEFLELGDAYLAAFEKRQEETE